MAEERDALRTQCAELQRRAQWQSQRMCSAEARREGLEREVHASRHAPAMRLQRILAAPLIGSGGLGASGASELDASEIELAASETELGASRLGTSGMGASGLGASRLGINGMGTSGLGASGLGSSRPGSPGRHREPAAFPMPFACAAGKAAEAARQSPRQVGLLDRSHSPKPKPSWL